MAVAVAEVAEGDTTNVVTNQVRFSAGRLSNFYSVWEQAGAPAIVLDAVRGYQLKFSERPPLVRPSQIGSAYNTPVSADMDKYIRELLTLGAVMVVKDDIPSFISPMFLVPKPGQEKRQIFNLKALNCFLTPPKFSLYNCHKLQRVFRRDDFLSSVDLTKAYFHVSIAQNCRRFLRFMYKGQVFEFQCLPFGLSTAPFIFQKLTSFVCQYLRKNYGIRIWNYLDDLLIAACSKALLSQHVQIVVNVFQMFGWIISEHKSELIPLISAIYIGLEWSPRSNYIAVPAEKIVLLRSRIDELLTRNTWHITDLRSIIGSLNFVAFAVPLGRLHMRRLQQLIPEMRRTTRASSRVPIPTDCRKDLEWWHLHAKDRRELFAYSPTDFLCTDASNSGWGGVLNDMRFSGIWNSTQLSLHINVKELLAVIFTVDLNFASLHNSVVSLQLDNSTVRTYFAKEGGTKSPELLSYLRPFLIRCTAANIVFVPYFIPGLYNCIADSLSRSSVECEWS